MFSGSMSPVRLQVLGNDVFDEHIAARDGGAHHIAAGFNLIGNDGVGAAVHAPHAVHLDDVCACPAHVGPHGVQKVRHVHNMRLFGHVFQNGEPVRHNGCLLYTSDAADE